MIEKWGSGVCKLFLPPHVCVQCLMAAEKELDVCWEPCDAVRSEMGLPDANNITFSPALQKSTVRLSFNSNCPTRRRRCVTMVYGLSTAMAGCFST